MDGWIASRAVCIGSTDGWIFFDYASHFLSFLSYDVLMLFFFFRFVVPHIMIITPARNPPTYSYSTGYTTSGAAHKYRTHSSRYITISYSFFVNGNVFLVS